MKIGEQDIPNTLEGNVEIDFNKLVIKIYTHDIWRAFPEEERIDMMVNSGSWDLIKAQLRYMYAEELSTPSFNSVLHELRVEILRDPAIVTKIVTRFADTLTHELQHALLDVKNLQDALWEANNKLDDKNRVYSKRPPEGAYDWINDKKIDEAVLELLKHCVVSTIEGESNER